MAFLLVGCAKQFESARRKHGTTLPPLGALRRRRGRRYEAGSRAESFVIVNGSHLRTTSVAVMGARSRLLSRPDLSVTPASTDRGTLEPTLSANAHIAPRPWRFLSKVVHESRNLPSLIVPIQRGFGEPTANIMRFCGARIRSVWSWP